MPGHEGPIDEGSLFDRPLSLCDSPDSSKLCEEMERSDTLKSRPGHLGSGLSIESTISALDMQLSKMQPPHSPEKTVDQLFDSLPKLFLSDPTKNRKRVEELDFQFQLLSEPSPNKKMKISQEGRTPKETSESEDLEAVTKQMDSRIYKELVCFYLEMIRILGLPKYLKNFFVANLYLYTILQTALNYPQKEKYFGRMRLSRTKIPGLSQKGWIPGLTKKV
ncbi:hypothetical protein FO519_009826, partial [Halicephalobus sp. NKZ332]